MMMFSDWISCPLRFLSGSMSHKLLVVVLGTQHIIHRSLGSHWHWEKEGHSLWLAGVWQAGCDSHWDCCREAALVADCNTVVPPLGCSSEFLISIAGGAL